MSTRPQLTPIDPQAGRYRTPRYSSRGGAEQMAQVARSLSGLSQTLRSSYATQQASTGQTEMQKFMDESESLYNLSPEKWQEKLETLQAQARKEQSKKVPIFKKLLKTGVVESPWELAAFQNGAYAARAKNFANKFYGQALTDVSLTRLQENPQDTLSYMKQKFSESDEYNSIISNPYGAKVLNDELLKYDSEYLEKQQEFRKEHETKQAVAAVVGTSFDILTSPDFFSENRINEIKDIVNDVVFIAEGSEREFIQTGLIPSLNKLASEGKKEQAKEILDQVYHLDLNNRGAKFTSAFEKGEYTGILDSLDKIDSNLLKENIEKVYSAIYTSSGEESVTKIVDGMVKAGTINTSTAMEILTSTDLSKLQNLLESRGTVEVNKANLFNTISRGLEPIDPKTYDAIISGESDLSETDRSKAIVYQSKMIGFESFLKSKAVSEATDTVDEALSPQKINLFTTFMDTPANFWDSDKEFTALKLPPKTISEAAQERISNLVKEDFRDEVRKRHTEIIDEWVKSENFETKNAKLISDLDALEKELMNFKSYEVARIYVAQHLLDKKLKAKEKIDQNSNLYRFINKHTGYTGEPKKTETVNEE